MILKDQLRIDGGALLDEALPRPVKRLGGRLSVRQMRRAITSDEVCNLLATAFRTAGKMCWGVAVPVLVSVENFGRYSVAMSAVSTAVQAGLMGTPQVILRNPQRQLPLGGLLLQALIVAIPAVVLLLYASGLGSGVAIAAGIAAVVAFVSQLTVSSRLKSVRLFPAVLASEAMGALVLISATAAIAFWPAGRGSFSTLIAVEVSCCALVAGVALVKGRHLLARDVAFAGTTSHLPRIYSIGALVLLEALFWRLQVLFLNVSAAGAEGAAVFAVALQLTQVLFLGAIAVTETWWPVIAQEHVRDRAAGTVLIRRRARQYMVGFAVMALILLAALPLLLRGPFHHYRAWTLPLVVFVAARLLSGFCGFFSGVLYATSNERSMYLPTLAGVLTSLIGGATVTIALGLSGAMVVFVSAQIVAALLTYRAYRNHVLGLPLQASV